MVHVKCCTCNLRRFSGFVTSNKKVAKTSQNCVALQSIAQRGEEIEKTATCARGLSNWFWDGTKKERKSPMQAETRSDLVPLHTLLRSTAEREP